MSPVGSFNAKHSRDDHPSWNLESIADFQNSTVVKPSRNVSMQITVVITIHHGTRKVWQIFRSPRQSKVARRNTVSITDQHETRKVRQIFGIHQVSGRKTRKVRQILRRGQSPVTMRKESSQSLMNMKRGKYGRYSEVTSHQSQ